MRRRQIVEGLLPAGSPEVEENDKVDIVQKLKFDNSTQKELIQLDENEEIEKEYDLNELLNFEEIDENIENKVISEISKIIEDVYNRKGGKVAAGLRRILLSYYDRIATHKFDIGCINGIEYSIPIKEYI